MEKYKKFDFEKALKFGKKRKIEKKNRYFL